MNLDPTNPEYLYFCKRILQLTGLDLTNYKAEQTQRRLRTIMLRFKVFNYDALLVHLEQNPSERQEFRDFFTINVSEFFRDAQFFEELRRVWLPPLLDQRKETTLRCWSAACSIGPEPYSLAILMEYYFPGHPYKILATDLDRTALEQARRGGPYPETYFNRLPLQLQGLYFQQKEDGYYVAPKLQAWINFRLHNLLQGPFTQRYDLLVCRNVIIYFTLEAKQALYRNLAISLRPGGILFLGGAEFINNPKQYGLRSLNGPFYTLA
ncbi:MAG: protein-glutamate O-methyltransferase CheR [Chloroflexota bacterium]|nr:protein-glutamate O-methyltransferase CheR [Chloroflexota bacterium]